VVAVKAGSTRVQPLPIVGDTLPALPVLANPPIPRAAAARHRRAASQATWTTWQGWHGGHTRRQRAPLQATLLTAFLALAVVATVGGLRVGDGLPTAIASWRQAAAHLFAPPKDTPLSGTAANYPAEFAGISIRPLFPEAPTFVLAEPEAADAVTYRPSAPEIVSAPARPWLDLELQQDIENAIPRDVGTVAIAVRHVSSGASAGINADRIMTPASTYKLGILLEAARQVEAGELRLDERLLLLPEDWADGAGILQSRIGEYVTVEDALRLMIEISDNTAALTLLRRIGPDAINQGYAELGLARTRIFTDYQPATATAWELSTPLTMLSSGQAAGRMATEYMLGLLALDQPQAWIASGTPGAPTDTIVAHKSGQLPGVRNDAALVYTPTGPYAIVVLTDDLWDESRGEALIQTIAAAVYDHFAAWLGSVPSTPR